MKNRFLKFILLVIVSLLCISLFSCDKTEYTLEKNGEMPDIHKGYFGEENSSFYPDINKYIKTNADDLKYYAESSNSDIARVECNKEKLTVTVLRGQGESEITVKVSSKKADKALEFKFKVTSELYARVACVGDSLTYGHTWNNESYPVYLSEILGNNIEVKNFGKNGASVTGINPPLNLKYSDQPEFTESLEYDADIVIIMLGTNDSKGWTDAEHIFKSEYESLISAYREKNPDVRIIAVTAPPTMENNKFSIPGNIITENIVPLQEEIASENGLTLVNFSGRFLDLMDHSDPYNEFIRGKAEDDGVHLNIDGAKFLAEIVAEAIFGL